MSSTPTPPEAENQLEGASTGSRPALRNPGLWMVPADRGRYVNDFVAGGYAGVDSTVDLSNLPSVGRHEELRTRYERQHPDKTRSQIGEPVSYLDGVLDMEKGDYVLTWEQVPDRIRYGEVVGPWYFLEETDTCPYRNRRSVQWSETLIETQRLPDAFREKLGVGGTRVFRVPFWADFMKLAEFNPASPAAESELSGPQSQDAPAPATVAPPPIGDTGVPRSPFEPRQHTASAAEVNPAEEDRVVVENDDDPVHAEQPSAPVKAPSQHLEGAPRSQRPEEDDSGLERDQLDDENPEIDSPFDPSRIRIRTMNLAVDLLARRIERDEIDLSPDFQRHSNIWKPAKRSQLIESLLLRIPIPVFYVAADADERWAVVDGVQRLSTITAFIQGKFRLSGLEYLTELNGSLFSDLRRAFQRRIEETQVVVNIIEPGTPEAVMFNIFHRINTGGEPLRAQEIRHAMNPGPVRTFLRDLAESEEFLQATAHGVSPKRMADRECVLRFLAFYISPWEDYVSPSLDAYLNDAMRRLNQMDPSQLDKISHVFSRTMTAAFRIFEDDAFRKRYDLNHSRYPLNLPLFEAWSVSLARCSADRQEALAAKKDVVRRRFAELLNEDSDFHNAVSYTTSGRQKIQKRFRTIQGLVEGILA